MNIYHNRLHFGEYHTYSGVFDIVDSLNLLYNTYENKSIGKRDKHILKIKNNTVKHI